MFCTLCNIHCVIADSWHSAWAGFCLLSIQPKALFYPVQAILGHTVHCSEFNSNIYYAMSKLTSLLKSRIVDLIRLKGSISVSEYMKIVLTNPHDGFYMNKDVFGLNGHFTTSPEISQMFGEIWGVWILQEWHRFGYPEPLRLVEFGPGRGTLMCDITRTLSRFKKISTDITLIEMSPHLMEVQKKSLAHMKRVKWVSHLNELDRHHDGFTAFIANEFLDALPIYKFVRDSQTKAWRELLVDYDQNLNLRFCISRQPSLSTSLVPQTHEGDHFEACPQAAATLEAVAERLNVSKGCMLICDYGFEGDDHDRDTFRAFQHHKIQPPLDQPGEADLTADVDFGYLKKHLQGKATIFGPVDQKDFLVRCGIETRLKALMKNAEKHEQEQLVSGAKMLIEDMGTKFKFLSIFSRSANLLFEGDPPAGF